MMRLPVFRYLAPRTLREAARMLAAEAGGGAALLAGGTDLLPNMKRRQQVPGAVIGLRNVRELKGVRNGRGMRLGAGLTLAEIVGSARVKDGYGALWQAAAQIATPQLRNMGTLGGNLCLDTRCNYYDQNYEWRKAIGFCMKKDGEICWVATSSPRCLAVSSTDTAPALIALGARVRLVSAEGERALPLRDLYRDDGIAYLARRPEEILVEVLLDGPGNRDAGGASRSSRGRSRWRSTYWKLRRRGSFDFPVLSVAAAVRSTVAGTVEEARIVLGGIASRPLGCDGAGEGLVGAPLTDAAIEQAADRVWKVVRPMDNTDFVYHWRKRVTAAFVMYALRELRGDDMRAQRLAIARQDLVQIV
jgi:4-hydroxybenzoyl-CoA reductase subunit beta